MSVISGRNQSTRSDGDKEGVTLSDRVPANTTDQEVTLEITQEATIERMSVRIYTGAELSLELYPFIRRDDNSTQPVIEMVGKSYVDGDDDYHEWDLSRGLEAGDELVIQATNNDGSNAYDYRVNVDIDYANGLSRFLGGVF